MNDEVERYQCRSGDCDVGAEWTVKIIPPDRKGADAWTGEFCLPHLMRCVPLKLRSIHAHQTLLISRLP
jgi:hypothetical protein